MDTLNPVAPPSIILTDNPDVAELFNDIKYSERSPSEARPSLAQVIGTVKDTFPKKSLFITNQNTGFISLEVQCMADGSPQTELTLFETSEFFELKLLRSATANMMAQKKETRLNGELVGPTKVFYIAFGIGDNLDYWAPFSSYYLIGAESFDDFKEARVITLNFAAGFGIGNFSTNTLKNFINPDLIQNGQVAAFDQFKLVSDEERDPTPNKEEDNENIFIKARRRYRQLTYPFYLAALDNLIEKTLQTIYNTDNVLVINYKPPFDLIETFIAEQNNAGGIELEAEYGKLRSLKKPPPADSDQLLKLRGFYKVLEDISTYFNINVAPHRVGGEPLVSVQSQVSKKDEELTMENIKTLGFSLNSDKNSGKDRDTINEMLSKFISGYNDLIGTNTYCYTREADISILKTVDKAIIEQFGSSFFDARKPLIVFGPKELVSNYFYGQIYDIDKNSDFAKTSQVVQKTVERKIKSVFNLYNSQNVNNTTLMDLIAENERVKQRLNNIVRFDNYPVFKYNMQNSNVLSIKISDNRAYFLLLDQAYSVLSNYASVKTLSIKDPTEKLTKSAEAEEINNEILRQVDESTAPSLGGYGSTGQLANINSKEIEAIREKFTEKRREAFAYKLSEATDLERLEIILAEGRDAPHIDQIIEATFFGRPEAGSEEMQEIKDTLYNDNISINKKLEFLRGVRGFDEQYLYQEAQVYANYLKKKYGLVALVEDSYARDPVKFFVDQMDVLDRVTFQVEIETLPFFPISNYAFIYTPCLLFAQRPSFVGDSKTRNPLDSISGAYNILGYKHTITTTNVKSVFKLFSLPKKP